MVSFETFGSDTEKFVGDDQKSGKSEKNRYGGQFINEKNGGLVSPDHFLYQQVNFCS